MTPSPHDAHPTIIRRSPRWPALIFSRWALAVLLGCVIVQHAWGESQNDLPAREIVISSVKPDAAPANFAPRFGVTRDDLARIVATVPGIQRVAPVRESQRQARFADKSLDVMLTGCTADFAPANGVKISRGRFLTAQDETRLNNVAVIDETTARRLFGPQDPIGKNLRIEKTYLLVVGVAKRHRNAAKKSIARIFIPISTMRSRFGDTHVIRRAGTLEAETIELSRIQIRVAVPAQSPNIARVIRALLDKYHEQRDYTVEVVLPRAGKRLTE